MTLHVPNELAHSRYGIAVRKTNAALRTPKAKNIHGAIGDYLRTCRSGGMSKELSDQISHAIGEAQRLGYFDGL